ncbi:MAG: ATP-binding protein [Lachnospiraceae bacterium]|jgi:predicted AAA+ superfamily ATPase|nr:ATP-binding protein [Lachnospiraceae bacterium]
MYIKRAIEDIIIKSERGFKAVLVTGARQVGKSTTLKHLHADRKYITFDDPVVLAETKREPGLFFRNNKPPLVLDEVQYITELFPYIKMECDNAADNGLICLTGSQQYHLMRNVSESLAGRVAILEMSGLSLRELQGVSLNAPFVPNQKYIEERATAVNNCDNIWEIIHRGSYPALVSEDADWQTFYSSYIKSYIERDINELGNVKDKQKFTRFMVALAARSGQIVNYTNIAAQAEITAATAKEWISLLDTSGIIHIMQPYASKALTRAIKAPKIYFRDTGLVCFLTKHQTAETTMNGAMAGEIFETFVVSEIIKSFSNAGLDYRFYVSYYRGKDKLRTRANGLVEEREAEIDIIIEQDDILYPVEIKMSANPRLDMTNAFDVIDRIPNKKRGTGVVLCMYDKVLWLNDNTAALPIEYI